MSDDQHYFDHGTFRIGATEFVRGFGQRSTADRFWIAKPEALVDQYSALCTSLRPHAIVELGIFRGGSTALLAQLATPRRLIVFDIDETPVPALLEFIDREGLRDVVRPHWGVDQADRTRLAAIVDEELAGLPLDLVIDDASHRLEPTRVSFEVLFPRVRPGGLYVIEDWSRDHQWAAKLRAALEGADLAKEAKQDLAEALAAAPAASAPLSCLAVELMVARATDRGAVDSITIDPYWITVRRGAGDLDPTGFRLSDHCVDHLGLLPS